MVRVLSSPFRRPRRLVVLAALVAAMAVLCGACASSGFAYVSSSDHRAYFKVPDSWHYFDKRDILIASGKSLSDATNAEFKWLVGFDADPHPDVTHLFAALKYPAILSQVQTMSFAVRDSMSEFAMRNLVFPVDQLLNKASAEIITLKDVTLAGGFHGIHMVYDVVPGGTATVSASPGVLEVNQTTVVDPSNTTLYLLLIQCESHCYRDYSSLIDQVAQSWTVKEH